MNRITKEHFNTIPFGSFPGQNEFDQLADMITINQGCSTIIMGNDGRIYGSALRTNPMCDRGIPETIGICILNIGELLQSIDDPRNAKCFYIMQHDPATYPCADGGTVIIPVQIGEERLGYLLLLKCENNYNDQDVILFDYFATLATSRFLSARRQVGA